jgi:hypothetical protein
VLDNDTFGPNATVTAATDGTNGTVTFNADGTVTYTPNEDFNGTDSFTYTVTTAAGDTETATVNVTVGPIVDAVNDTITTDEDTANSINVLDNDTFGPNATVTAATDGTNGTVTFNADGTVTYTPNGGFYGSDSFSYTVTTAAGNTETALVNVSVNAAPIAIDDPDPFKVSLGSFTGDVSDWSDTGVTSIDAAYGNDSRNLKFTNFGVGVEGREGGTPDQLEYNRNEGLSETITFNFERAATQGEFEASRLFSNEVGVVTEQGKWTAYLNGVEVASSLFSLPTGSFTTEGNFDIDTGGLAFNKLVFEAVEFVQGPFTVRENNSSDYFIKGLTVEDADGVFAFNQNETISIAVTDILENDSDIETQNADLLLASLGPAYDNAENNVGTVSLIGDDLIIDVEDGFSGALSFNYTISDGSAESNTATVDLFINPVSTPQTLLVQDAASNTLVGSSGFDILNGGEGSDTLQGQGGNDILVGGLGDDILTGGEGSDLFKWIDMDNSVDFVTDYNIEQGDRLDLTDLLEDQTPLELDNLLSDLASGDNQGQNSNVSITITDNGTDAQLSINKDGQTLTVDFEGTLASDVTKGILDSFKFSSD